MEILKKQIGIAAIMLLSMSAIAQSDATIQKGFRDSYTQENNKLYGFDKTFICTRKLG